MTERRLILEFTKMSGAGNDFIVVDNRFYHFTDDELSGLARALCPRRTGIGADGILGLNLPRHDGHDYRFRYFNADGSAGTMCGNGARCLVRFAWNAGFAKENHTFETDAGEYSAHIAGPGGPVRLFVPPPQRFRPDFPLAGTPQHGLEGHYIWTGTEHLVCYVSDVVATPVQKLGPVLRSDAALPHPGANVNFVEPLPDGSLRVRTFEKGVEAETLACGTGAMATALVSVLTDTPAAGHHERTIHMPGGDLLVGFDLDGALAVSGLFLEGPAIVVFRGSVEV